MILKAGISIVKAFGNSGTEKSLIKTAREFGFQFECFADISREEEYLKDQYTASYLTESKKVEAEIKDLESNLDRLKKTIESKSLEIEENISLRIKNYEKEMDELENLKFSLSSLFSYLKAKIALYKKKKFLRDFRLNPQKEVDKSLNKEFSELRSLTNRFIFLKGNKEDEIRKRLGKLYENLENIGKIKNSHEYKGAVGELKVIKDLEILPDSYFCLMMYF